jgi:hypothetical protein
MVCVIAISLSDLRTISTGNGTQSIVWQINEEAYQAKLATEAEGPVTSFFGNHHLRGKNSPKIVVVYIG